MKEKISATYIQDQKSLHSRKLLPKPRRCVVTGVSPNNIGEKIADLLERTDFEVYIQSHERGDLTDINVILRMLYVHENIDTIILCHAIAELSWIEDQKHEQANRIIDVNLISNMKIIAEFAKMTMKWSCRKTIIVIGSMASSMVANGSAPYCASKAGLQHYIKCAAWELAPKGFDVYLINPSNVIDTPMTNRIIEDLAEFRNITLEEAYSYWGSTSVRGEFLQKGEIAKLTRDLALGKFPYLCGTPLNMTGGQR
jgi:NAD(P)-dependent dehydrogenase (short-subunit alcohol dehydrogenase family)